MAMPTTGALLINPRRRRRKATKRKSTRRSTASRRKNTAASRRSSAAKKAAATRRRNAAARSRAAKKAAATRRRNGTHKGMARKTARRAYMKRRSNGTRKGMARKTARRAYTKRRNPAHKRKNMAHSRRRRNPNVLAGLQQSVKRIPVVGPIASDAVGLGIPALFGAISIEPVMMGLKFGGQYIPAPLQKMSFTIGGLVMGAIIKNAKFIGTPELRKQFAVAVATAGGAVDYYRFKTGQGTVTAMAAAEKAGWGEMEIESLEELDGLGELELAVDGWGDLEIAEDMSGFGELELAVDGWGDFDEDDMDGWAGWGDLDEDSDEDDFDGWGDITVADADFSGDDMSPEEIGAFAGAHTFGQFATVIKRVAGSTRTGMSPSISTARTQNLNRSRAIGLRSMVAGAQRPTTYYYKPGDLIYQGRSPQAGTFGGRWFWLIKVIGYDRARQVAMLPTMQRQAYIGRLRQSASRVHQLRLARSTGQFSTPMYATA